MELFYIVRGMSVSVSITHSFVLFLLKWKTAVTRVHRLPTGRNCRPYTYSEVAYRQRLTISDHTQTQSFLLQTICVCASTVICRCGLQATVYLIGGQTKRYCDGLESRGSNVEITRCMRQMRRICK